MNKFIKIRKRRMRKTIKVPTGDKVFTGLTLFFLIFFCALVIVPIMNLVSFAFSTGTRNSEVTFLPVGFTFDMFSYVMKDSAFWRSALNSVIITK